jgi:hypothetical protein
LNNENFFSCNINSGAKRVDLNVKQDWLTNWRAAMKEADHTNSWSGSMFYNHPIWEKGLGLRNILLELSFDDFPPFEEKSQHSFGIVSVVPQNLSTQDKINKRFIWPIVFIPGPKAPKRLNGVMAEFIQDLKVAYEDGIQVYDPITGEDIVIFVGPGSCSCDLPASERIGGFLGCTAYYGCKYCFYRATVCSHTKYPAAKVTEIPLWHNENATVNQTRVPVKIKCSSSKPVPKLKSGEHKCWADTSTIPKHMLKTDKYVRQAQKAIMAAREQELRDLDKQRLQTYLVSHESPFTVFDSKTFPLPSAFALDFMHMLLERIAGRTLKILFRDDEYKILGQASNRFDHSFKPAWVKNKLPASMLHVSWWSAGQVFEFCKNYFCMVIDDLVDDSMQRCVAQLCQLITTLSCTRIPREWMKKHLEFQVKVFLKRQGNVFGPCNMSIYYHLLLHLADNIELHGNPMATWLFSQERLNKDLIRSAAASNPRRFGYSVALRAGDYVIQNQLSENVICADWMTKLTKISEGEAEPEIIKPSRLWKKTDAFVVINNEKHDCYAEWHCGQYGRIRVGDLVRCRQDQSMYFVPHLFFQTTSVMAQVRWWFKGTPHPRLPGHQILEKIAGASAAGKKYVSEFDIGPSVCATPSASQGSYVVCDSMGMLLFT